jgi:DNA-binding LacI/PurR family transcriptional regulator
MNENLGDISIKMVLDQFNKNSMEKPGNVVLKSKLIIRDSVKNMNNKL